MNIKVLPSSSEEAALMSPASSLSLLRSLTSSSSSFSRRSSLALSIFVVFEDLDLAGIVFSVVVLGAAGSSSPSDAGLSWIQVLRYREESIYNYSIWPPGVGSGFVILLLRIRILVIYQKFEKFHKHFKYLMIYYPVWQRIFVNDQH
jgi:hypothetical protein